MRNALIVIACIVLLAALIAAVSFGSLGLYRYFAPQWESARTDTYRENKSYVEGTIRDLRDLKRQWTTARDDDGKRAIAELAKQRAGELDYDRLPRDVREWLKDIEE